MWLKHYRSDLLFNQPIIQQLLQVRRGSLQAGLEVGKKKYRYDPSPFPFPSPSPLSFSFPFPSLLTVPPPP